MKVSLVETQQIDLPQDMQRALAKQAEAELFPVPIDLLTPFLSADHKTA